MELARRRKQAAAPDAAGEDGDFVQLRLVREVYLFSFIIITSFNATFTSVHLLLVLPNDFKRPDTDLCRKKG